MRRNPLVHGRALQTSLLLALCLGLATACKERSASDDGATDGDAVVEASAPPPPSPAAIAALDALVTLEAPALGAPCAAEAALVGELLLELRPELDQVSATADDGLSAGALAPITAALQARIDALDTLAPADDEVARAHRELGAALADLAVALTALAAEPAEPGVALRLENGADNLGAALAALDRACAAR